MPEGQKKASAEGRSHPQELEEGPRSGPHLLVCLYRTHPHAQDRSLVCQSDRMTGNCHYMADNSKF
jgi:hypothetical protein